MFLVQYYMRRRSTKQNTTYCITYDTIGRRGGRGTIEYRTPGINNSVEVRVEVFDGGLILEYLIVEVFDVLGP